ncbi:type II secretion system protein [Agaribacterium haliotis]|uniref:type II secretion system protein n=1 Tax=Agaribacterium haliotis TaxID=2013869 RepID=UPI00130401DE|nr:type II secretion system protein [Agaribacterium haliotis]
MAIQTPSTMQRCAAFTLVELSATLVIIGILAAAIVPKFIDLSDEADNAHIDTIVAAMKAGEQQVLASYYIQGAPGLGQNGATVVSIDNIPVRFNNGQIRTTESSDHVPAGTQNRNSAYSRLFFLFLEQAPGPLVNRNSAATGWVMLGNNNRCAAGQNPRRCWEYRKNGNRLARITYYPRERSFVRD